MNDYIFTIFFFALAGLIYISSWILHYRNDKRINAMSIVRLMYFVIYSLVPIITLHFVSVNGIDHKTRSLDLSQSGLNTIVLYCIFAIVGYFAMEVGYSLKKKIVIGPLGRGEKRTIHYDNRALSKAATLMIFISLIALFMWTYPFGGPIAMFEYGSMIRSGYEITGINNSFGFMKQFVPLAMFASVVSLGLVIDSKRGVHLLQFVVSFAISIVYLIANDGRAPFLMYFVSLLVLFSKLRKRSRGDNGKDKLLPVIVIGIIGFLFIENIDTITALFTGKAPSESSSVSIGKFFYDEFSWTVRNPQAVKDALANGEGGRFFKEILSGIFACLPSRFRPSWLMRLEKINTVYWHGSLASLGGKPPEIITTGIYCFYYPGIIILPFIYGYIVNRVDGYFNNRDNSIYYDILFVQLIYQLAKTVAYTDFALISLNLFYLIVGHLIVVYFNRPYSQAVYIEDM